MNEEMNEELIELTNQLRNARGKEFVRLLKETYLAISPLLKERATEIKEKENKLTPMMVGSLADEFNLCVKHAFKFLEELQIIKWGTYNDLISRGLKARDILKK